MLTTYDKAPFPYYGGKRFAAAAVWAALGDVSHYVSPFCGSLAVELLRPHPCNRPYYSETVNDADGLLVNALRALALSPDATAEAASWYVCEADMHARHLACLAWGRDADNLARLMGTIDYHDPVIAGYWIYGMSCWIGSGWCSGEGPWRVDADGRLSKRPGGVGVARKLPHLGDNGRGVNHAGAREPGVARQLPHLGDDGQGVNRPQAREPGVSRKLPHLGNNGQGVNRPQAREPGVSRKLPHLGNNGQGVNRPQAREAGVSRKLPHLGNNGRGVNRPQAREAGVAADTSDRAWEVCDFHPMTMPEVRAWFGFLAARLRHVRIINGDWRRVVTSGVIETLPVRQGKGAAGIFLDPPYTNAERAAGLYTHDDGDVAADVRAWCHANGANPRYRIVLAGFAGEGHETLEAAGWRVVPWFTSGYLRGGMANQSEAGHQQNRERLWLSPHCLTAQAAPEASQIAMFDEAA